MKAYLLSPDKKNYSNHKGDFGLLKEIFELKHVEVIEVESLPEGDRAFVVIPGYDSLGYEEFITNELSKIKRVVLFVTSDEAGFFDPSLIKHDNIEIWVQSPFPKHEAYHKLPIGCPFTMKSSIPEYPTKVYDVFFSGQVTHQRRQELASVMPNMQNAFYNPTKGFMQGFDPKDYYRYLSQSRIVPAPAGNVTIDSFRFYEGIEMLSVPIADSKNAIGEDFDFFRYVFPENFPALTTSNWNELPDLVENILEDYSANLHRIVSWWIKYKRDFANKIMEQVYEH